VFTARYALSPYIKQIRFVFKRLISQVRDLACTSELESYASGSLGTFRATQAREVLSEALDKERYPGPAGKLLGVGRTSSPRENPIISKP
jgi:hypothetical protein